ncbi:hypothetical protein SESBI_48060 [Sesbania bispinosa]|nr:hypothetical protein SESBI_48060 [Sesbania bispinosa]
MLPNLVEKPVIFQDVDLAVKDSISTDAALPSRDSLVVHDTLQCVLNGPIKHKVEDPLPGTAHADDLRMIGPEVGGGVQLDDLRKIGPKISDGVQLHACLGEGSGFAANGLGVLITNFESPDVATQLTCPAMYDGIEEVNNCATPNTVLLTSQVEDTETCAQSVSHSPEAVLETQNVGSDELQCSNPEAIPVVKVPVPNASLLAEDNLCEVPITAMENITMVEGKATTLNTRNPVKKRGRPKKNPNKLQVSDSFLLDKEPNEIAKSVWHLGLQLGVSGVMDETTMIAKLIEMASRDGKAVGRSTGS